MSTLPHGKGPDDNARILIRCGIPIYDHPITPFQDAVLCCAATAGLTIREAVADLQSFIRPDDPEIHECLDWIRIRFSGAGAG